MQKAQGQLFLSTLSFLFTTPGVVATHAAGLTVLSSRPGQFGRKDVVLIGVAIWTLGEALRATPRIAATPQVQSLAAGLP
jgi:uncharacterized membrane protein YkgB